MSFYGSTATFFLLHCDEWNRVVALPRHKFVTGATLLQLGKRVITVSRHSCVRISQKIQSQTLHINNILQEKVAKCCVYEKKIDVKKKKGGISSGPV